jgi:lipid-binding SYLF domain-containing protein
MEQIMRKTLVFFILIAGVLSLVCGTVFAQKASDAKAERERVQKSVGVFQDLLNLPEKGIPPALLKKAQAIAIIPGLLKAAYVVGGEHGRGVIAVRLDNGEWSDPAFISMTGGSLGFQIGVEKSDIILVFKDKASVATIANGKFTLGGGASVAAGPVGRSAQASTDINFESEVYSYSKAKGAFAGISINGASLQMDKDANEHFYQKFGIRVDDILSQNLSAPPEARELRNILDRSTK